MNKSTLIRWVTIAAAAAAAQLPGCERRERLDLTRGDLSVRDDYQQVEREEPTAIGGGPVDVPTAFVRIVHARCDREAACGFISEEAKWASRDACLEVVSREYADDLTETSCPNGVDGPRLAECVSSARTSKCGLAIDVIGRVPECRNARICRP